MNIWIYGAGDLGREIYYAIQEINNIQTTFNVLGFLDDTEGFEGKVIEGLNIKNWNSLTGEQIKSSYFIIAVGNGVARKKIREKIESQGGELSEAVIHPKSYIATNVKIKKGVYIGPNTTVSIGTKVDKNVVINQNCSIGHDCEVEEDVVISPGCVLSGRVSIGRATFLGSGAIILPRMKIEGLCVIGANVTVSQNVNRQHKVLAVTRNMSLPIEEV